MITAANGLMIVGLVIILGIAIWIKALEASVIKQCRGQDLAYVSLHSFAIAQTKVYALAGIFIGVLVFLVGLDLRLVIFLGG